MTVKTTDTWGPEAWAASVESRLKGKTIEQAGGELKRHGYKVAHNQLTGKPIVGQKVFGGTTVHGFHKETDPYTSGHSVFLHSTNGTHVSHVETSGPHVSRDEDHEPIDVKIIGDVEPDTIQMFDNVEMDDAAKVRIIDGGYLVANPRIARTGIQLYSGDECGRPDMERVRVYRPAESVFAKDTVKNFTHLPVTLGHPKQLVTADSWRQDAVGDTGDEVLRDGGTVRVPMIIRDAAAVKAVKDGKNQLSVGYTCDLDWVSGTTEDGEAYDAVQKNIKGNHLAIVTNARGGSTLRIGDDQQQQEDHAMQLKNVTVDGIECQMTDTAASIVQRTIQRTEDASEKARKTILAVENDRDSIQEKLDAALKSIETKDGELAALKVQLKNATDPANIDAQIKDRQVVVDRARAIHPQVVVDGRSVGDIRKQVVESRIGTAVAGWSDAKIEGAFDSFPAKDVARGGNYQDAALAFSRPHFATVTDEREKAYADREKADSEAWRGPQKQQA